MPNTQLSKADFKTQQELRNKEKEWDELLDTQKIERMREIIKSLQQSFNYANNRIANLERLNEHSHIDGKVVVPLNPHGYGLCGTASKTVIQNYF